MGEPNNDVNNAKLAAAMQAQADASKALASAIRALCATVLEALPAITQITAQQHARPTRRERGQSKIRPSPQTASTAAPIGGEVSVTETDRAYAQRALAKVGALPAASLTPTARRR